MTTKTCKKCPAQMNEYGLITIEPLAYINAVECFHACGHDWQEQEPEYGIFAKHNQPITRLLRCIKCQGLSDTYNFLGFDKNCQHEYEAYLFKEDQQMESPIRFIVKNESNESQLTFGMVERNQFFVDKDGYLCQKVNSCTYNSLTDEACEPYADSFEDIDSECPVQKILPHIIKVEF